MKRKLPLASIFNIGGGTSSGGDYLLNRTIGSTAVSEVAR